MGTKPFDFTDTAELKAYLMDVVSQQIEMYPPSGPEYRRRVAGWVRRALQGVSHDLDAAAQDALVSSVLAELIGYGPIQPLLEDPTINEIMVVGADQVYVEREGRLEDTSIRFNDEAHVIRVINRILHPLGRSVSMDSPTADARLPDGSRVHVVIPPISVDGPCITIRRFVRQNYTVDELVENQTLTYPMAEFLRACVAARLNILVSGNTSAGKTTLLNVLSGFIPGDERIILIEDAAELHLQQKYLVRLETRPGDSSGRGEVTTRDLVRNALRMRPDRIVIGEVRGPEALDLLQALNTGHDGSMTTLHANSARDAIARLETMASMAGLEMPVHALRQQIAAAIDLIVHMERATDGSRRVLSISEVRRLEGEMVTMTDVFGFEQTGMDSDGRIEGRFRPTGLRPSFMNRLEAFGQHLKADVFWERRR